MDQNAIYLGPDGEVFPAEVREFLVDETLFSTIEKELDEIGNGGYSELYKDAIMLGYQGPAHLSTTEYEAAEREVETIFASTLSKKEKAMAVARMDLGFVTSYLELLTNKINGIKKKAAYLQNNMETKQ